MIAIATVAVACVAPLLFQAAPKQPESARFEQLTRDGARLTKEQAAALEQTLGQSPDDLNTRAKLLGYYFVPASQAPTLQAVDARRAQILWLVRNHPDSALLMAPAATIDPEGHALADPDGYAQVRTAWMEQTAKKDASAAQLGNAARFFLLNDKALAVSYYARARKLEPQDATWAALQGSAMAFAVIGITGQNQNGFPGPADPAAATSEQAKTMRRELEISNDAAVLRAAAGELMGRGFMAQSMAQLTFPDPPVKALDLAETLLARAAKLETANRENNLGLARLYQLRAMAAASEEDKKKFQLLRYQELVKGSAGLAPDVPHDALQLLELARASMDAGEVGRAEALARSLLAHLPNDLFAADTITHHANMILGGAALRASGVMAAKEYLLASAGVKNGRGPLSSFGPNMMLAKELLEKGETKAVIQYLELCRKFWTFNNKIDLWIADIDKGRIPEFGANLTY